MADEKKTKPNPIPEMETDFNASEKNLRALETEISSSQSQNSINETENQTTAEINPEMETKIDFEAEILKNNLQIDVLLRNLQNELQNFSDSLKLGLIEDKNNPTEKYIVFGIEKDGKRKLIYVFDLAEKFSAQFDAKIISLNEKIFLWREKPNLLSRTFKILALHQKIKKFIEHYYLKRREPIKFSDFSDFSDENSLKDTFKHVKNFFDQKNAEKIFCNRISTNQNYELKQKAEKLFLKHEKEIFDFFWFYGNFLFGRLEENSKIFVENFFDFLEMVKIDLEIVFKFFENKKLKYYFKKNKNEFMTTLREKKSPLWHLEKAAEKFYNEN